MYYTASSTPGNTTATSSTTSITVTGLTNGQAYTFKVTATNAAGTSTPSSASNSVTPALITYTIGGTISGLTGTLVLQNNGGDNLSTTTNGSFVFATAITNGSAYNASVLTQPSGQTCTITNGSGNVSGANVTNISVSCANNSTYTIGGTISGLSGTVVLQNNSGDNLSVSANGAFTFATATGTGASYAVTVLTQPSGQTCTVSSGSGTVASANITSVSVSCANNSSPGGGGGGGGGSSLSYPIISQVRATSVTNNSALISWITDLSADSKVEFGTSTAYGLSVSDTVATTTHKLTLTNLIPFATYHFRAISKAYSYASTASSDYTFVAGVSAPVQIPPQASQLPTSTPANIKLKLINDGGTFYLIQNNVRYGVTSPGILYSYGFEFKDAKIANAADLALPSGSLLLPNTGSLVKSNEDKTVYLIVDGQRRAFVSARIFLGLGFKFGSVLLVTNPELQALPKGSDITNSTAAHTSGINISYKGTVYYISHNTRHPYPSMAVYNSWNIDNDFSQVIPANNADLKVPIGSPVEMRVIE
ncbi:MAG: hypothetical protein M1383_00570 [Patescibacteria group bacterium]|nr:hypothetical protein [Patescibacteria group bacterium]